MQIYGETEFGWSLEKAFELNRKKAEERPRHTNGMIKAEILKCRPGNNPLNLGKCVTRGQFNLYRFKLYK